MSVVDIRQNLFWAFVNNMVGIPPAGLDLFGPILAGSAMAFSNVNVVSDPPLLRRRRPGAGRGMNIGPGAPARKGI
jgi:Cu+-exporting ATPase